jgi:hypothetical protein
VRNSYGYVVEEIEGILRIMQIWEDDIKMDLKVTG